MADLITTADVTNPKLLGLPAADLANLISAASEMFEAECNRVFPQTSLTEAHDGKDLGRVWLRRPPVLSVDQVVLNGTPIDNTDGLAWSFRPDTGELRRGPPWGDARFAARFPAGIQNVVVTYTGGYFPIPADLKRACLIQVKHLFDLSTTTGLLKSERLGDYAWEMNPEAMTWSPVALKVADRYRI